MEATYLYLYLSLVLGCKFFHDMIVFIPSFPFPGTLPLKGEKKEQDWKKGKQQCSLFLL